MNYFLDTSALLVHALNEAGAADVQSLFENDSHDLYFSALSLFELAGVLRLHDAEEQTAVYWETYQQAATVVPVDAELAQAAWRLRATLDQRIPMADAVIAAAARSIGATLVHRDKHLAAIPDPLLPQIRLPSPVT